MKITAFCTLLFVLLLLNSSLLQSKTPGDPGWCAAKCGLRCSKAEGKEKCLKYCGACCSECKCVPSGTHRNNRNKHECPCYRDMKNSKGKSKCP